MSRAVATATAGDLPDPAGIVSHVEWAPIATGVVGLAGIIVAGVIGPRKAASAAREADERRFVHERGLKASDDVLARIDDVAGSLEVLEEACATLRGWVAGPSLSEPARMWELVRDAEDAFQRSRASIARLAMRPHASGELVEAAEGASKAFHKAAAEAPEARGPSRTGHFCHGVWYAAPHRV